MRTGDGGVVQEVGGVQKEGVTVSVGHMASSVLSCIEIRTFWDQNVSARFGKERIKDKLEQWGQKLDGVRGN